MLCVLCRIFERLDTNCMLSHIPIGRQIALELYMTRVVETMPEVVDSAFLNVFLNMKNRINVIRSGLLREEHVEIERNLTNGVTDEESMRLSIPHHAPGSSAELSLSGPEGGNPTEVSALPQKYSDEVAAAIRNIDLKTMSSDEAERKYTASVNAKVEADPLGGATNISETEVAIIKGCTEDQICDLEELMVTLRDVYRRITSKVLCVYIIQYMFVYSLFYSTVYILHFASHILFVVLHYIYYLHIYYILDIWCS